MKLPGIFLQTDNLHTSINFTITFDRTIDEILVELDNNNLTDSINSGLARVDYQDLTLNSTQLLLEFPAGGGLTLFEHINSITISHVNNNGINDGFDFAFSAISAPVLEPETLVLLGSGVADLALYRHRIKTA